MGVIHKWDYQKIENGTSIFGWIAGNSCGVWTHFNGKTKPCRRRMSDHQLQCPFCESKHVPVWRGYLPFYDAQYTRQFILISEDYEESVSEIPHLAQIKLTRAKGTREPVVVTPYVWRSTPLPVAKDRTNEVDLMPFLLQLWKDVELQEWSRSAPVALPAMDDEAELAARRDAGKRELEKIAPHVAARFNVPYATTPQTLADTLPNLTAKMNGSVKANGKPKN